jgi:hypothetical protein
MMLGKNLGFLYDWPSLFRATRRCPHCKALRKTTKQLSLSRLPPILIIHLKRFSFEGRWTDKIDTFVDFPMKALDLTNFMPLPLPPGVDKGPMNALHAISPDDPRSQLPPYRYDLYAVTNHFGSLSSGHCKSTEILLAKFLFKKLASYRYSLCFFSRRLVVLRWQWSQTSGRKRGCGELLAELIHDGDLWLCRISKHTCYFTKEPEYRLHDHWLIEMVTTSAFLGYLCRLSCCIR